MLGPAGVVLAIKTSHNEMRNTHANGSCDQDGLASKLINIEDCRNGGQKQENTTHSASKQRDSISSETQVFENELKFSILAMRSGDFI